MIKISFLFIATLAIPLFGECQIHSEKFDAEKIYDYIKKDLSKEFSWIDSINLLKANTMFSFALAEFLQDVISEQYITGFSFAETKKTPEVNALIGRVHDSLEAVSDKLNKFCEANEVPATQLKRSENILYLFFSPFCEQKLYVHVLHSQGILLSGNEYYFQGSAHTYLFVFSNSEIIKVYKGLIAHN